MTRPRHHRKSTPRPLHEAGIRVTSPGRQRIFWIITLAIPLLILVLLETGLRIAEYGGDLRLVVRKTVGGKEYSCINRAVARRYFPGYGAFVPEPRDQTFQLHKGQRTRRIFCLGESTMAGFPFDFHATAPSFLSDRLAQLFPEDTVEVVNVGLSAIGSFVVLDFVDELLEYDPDLFIIYLGHNEFYGVYGGGSSLAVRGGPWMTRLTISLLHTRIFLLARNLYASLANTGKPSRGNEVTLMEHVVGEERIPYGSGIYSDAREAYRDNLLRIIGACKSHRVPVIFTALVSNIRARRPFEPMFADASTAEQRMQHATLLHTADSLVAQGNVAGAFERCIAAIALDSMHAGGWFQKGIAAYALGDYAVAEQAFTRARDLDALRFRATGDFQNVLLSVCAGEGVPVVRADSVFATASPHGIIGSELMMEHLHPNIHGYFLMGKAMAEAMQANGVLFPPGRWQAARPLSDEEYFARSAVSDFDSLCGAIRTELLLQHWPFPASGTPAGYAPATPEAAVAYAYVTNRQPWQLARYDMASVYERRQKFDLARRECLAVAKAMPHSYEPLLRVADYFRMEGNRTGAEEYYRLSYRTEENAFAPLKLGMVLIEESRNAEAVEQIAAALAVEQRRKPQRDAGVTATAHYFLAVALAKSGRFDDAKENVQMALQLNPQHPGARDLQRQLEEYRRRSGTH